MTNNKQAVVMVLRQLLSWYDRDESDDDELERIVVQARGLVQQSELNIKDDPRISNTHVL